MENLSRKRQVTARGEDRKKALLGTRGDRAKAKEGSVAEGSATKQDEEEASLQTALLARGPEKRARRRQRQAGFQAREDKNAD